MNDGTQTELVTIANFDEARYLAANGDVAAYVAAGGDARAHFLAYGQAEGRRQLIEAAGTQAMEFAARRYARFRHLLDAGAGGGGAFSFAGDEGRFPLLYGDTPYDLATYDAESANIGFGPFVNEVQDNPDRLYADIGCGRRPMKADNCLYVEVYASRSADIVMAPATRYPIASGSLDGIGCFAVLEHVTEPWKVVAEFTRMLKPGGKVFIDWPFLQPVHGFPSHYYNATRAGLERMFADDYDIDLVDTLANQTPAHTIAWYLSVLLADLRARGSAALDPLTAMSVAQLAAEDPTGPFWTETVSQLSSEAVMTLACGNSLIARKR